MSGEKPWYKSKGVWGGIIAAVAAGASAFGIDVSAGAQDDIVKHVTSLAGAVGGLLAVVGRVMADTKIEKRT